MESKLKSDIIAEFVVENVGNDEYEDFFNFNDLGIPLSLSLKHNLCILTKEGMEAINETYLDLCSHVNIDDEYEYKSVDDFMGDIGDLDIEE